MGSATVWVRQALAELGPDTPDQKVKAYVRLQDPTVPESHISLALRRLRGKVIPTRRDESQSQQLGAEPLQGELFPE
jgi:hypothetical protein